MSNRRCAAVSPSLYKLCSSSKLIQAASQVSKFGPESPLKDFNRTFFTHRELVAGGQARFGMCKLYNYRIWNRISYFNIGGQNRKSVEYQNMECVLSQDFNP